MISYKKDCFSGKIAVLFTVARGHFSEGYNFKDNLCRAVIIIGKPNLYINDPKLLLKNKLL